MKAGDLVKTVYRDEWAIVIYAWWVEKTLVDEAQWGVEFIYPSDGSKSCQPMKNIKEVISESR